MDSYGFLRLPCYKSVVQRCEGGNVRSDRRRSAVSALRIFVRRADGGGGARCRLRRWGVHVPVGWWMGSSILPPPISAVVTVYRPAFHKTCYCSQCGDAQQQPRRRYSGTSYEALVKGFLMDCCCRSGMCSHFFRSGLFWKWGGAGNEVSFFPVGSGAGAVK